MRHLFHDKARQPANWATWSPLLVLGLSVIAAVVLINAGMAMLPPEADGVGASAERAGTVALAPARRG